MSVLPVRSIRDIPRSLWETFYEWEPSCLCAYAHLQGMSRCLSVCLGYPPLPLCVSQGRLPSLGSVGWPVVVCPYRNTGAGQPQAIWRGSLVCWLASHAWTTAHTQQPPPWRLKTEALGCMLTARDWCLRDPDFIGLQGSCTFQLEATERVSYLKMSQENWPLD